jgi:UDP:flavonoid glycosyltransferase YjiC (YdhE family)
MKKLLVFAEGSTLAHVARPLALAHAASGRFEVVIAMPPQYRWAVGNLAASIVDLDAQSPEEFARRLEKGDPLYDLPTLQRYVTDDLALIERFAPDCIIGDFRLSLGVSARLAGITYLALGNAYWSPFYRIDGEWPVPDLPLTRMLPIGVARWLFNRVRPFAFRAHARAIEALRRQHGLPGIDGDLRRAYTDADITCYTDIPSVFQLRDAPSSHRVVGPLPWAPPVSLPSWWNEVPDDRPIAYVSMGSSGKQSLSAPLAAALVDAGFCVLVTAEPEAMPVNPMIFASRFMPGDLACARAAVVICNGGSPTTQQALTAGKPVVGVASNLDQFLNMAALDRAGLGRVARADRFNAADIASVALESLRDREWQERVQSTRGEIQALDAADAILAVVS